MIIIDVEIKKAIPDRREAPIDGIEYCAGWRDFANMGISCVCTYDIVSHLSRVFTVGSRANNLADLVTYLDGKPTAGFNTKRFDLPLLEANQVICRNPEQHYDILEQIWLSLGLNPDKFVPSTHGGWGLDAVCGATLGIRKTGHGAAAPMWWQQGQHGRVIDYCLNDVWMEGQLLLHILMGGLVTNGKQSIRVALPTTQVQTSPPYVPQVPPLMCIDPATDPPTVTVVAAPGQYERDGQDITSQVAPVTGGLGIIR